MAPLNSLSINAASFLFFESLFVRLFLSARAVSEIASPIVSWQPGLVRTCRNDARGVTKDSFPCPSIIV